MDILQQSLKVLSLILARLLVVNKRKNPPEGEGRGCVFQELGQSFPFAVAVDKSYRRDAADSLQQVPHVAVPAHAEEDVRARPVQVWEQSLQ